MILLSWNENCKLKKFSPLMNGKHVSDMDMVGVCNNAYVCIKKNVIYQQQNIVSNLIWERKREKKIIEKGNEEIYFFFRGNQYKEEERQWNLSRGWKWQRKLNLSGRKILDIQFMN